MRIEDYLVHNDTSGEIKYSPCLEYGVKTENWEKKDGSILCEV
jgi:hypothetical protein